jgi:hypothetical protein
VPHESHRDEHADHRAHTDPAEAAVGACPQPGADRAAQVGARHVRGVEPAADVGAEAVDPHLVGDHPGLHADVEQQGAPRQGGEAGRTAQAAEREDQGRDPDHEEADEVDRVRAAPVHRAPRERRAQHGRRVDQGEQPGGPCAQAVHRARQQQRHTGPHGGEAGEHRGLVEAGAAQLGFGAQQSQRRGEQGGVALGGGGRGRRQGAGQERGEQQGESGREDVRRTPAQPVAQRAPGCAGQQHAREGTAQQGAADHAPPVLRDQAGGERSGQRGDHRRRAHQHGRGEQRDERGRGTRGEQAGPGQREQGDEQPTGEEPVAERDEQEDAGRVAELGRRHHRSGRAGGDAQPRGHQRADGLREVDVAHGHTTGERQQRDQPGTRGRRPRCTLPGDVIRHGPKSTARARSCQRM